jgi:hypothetical protein
LDVLGHNTEARFLTTDVDRSSFTALRVFTQPRSTAALQPG